MFEVEISHLKGMLTMCSSVTIWLQQLFKMLKTTKMTWPRAPPEGLFCNYGRRVCMLNRVDGAEFCLKHILEDKTSSYKPCSFVSNRTGRRCVDAAPKTDKRDG